MLGENWIALYASRKERECAFSVLTKDASQASTLSVHEEPGTLWSTTKIRITARYSASGIVLSPFSRRFREMKKPLKMKSFISVSYSTTVFMSTETWGAGQKETRKSCYSRYSKSTSSSESWESLYINTKRVVIMSVAEDTLMSH
jgi:hypothetical protein